MDASAVSDWCKDNYDNRTWSKLSEEEQIEALYKIDKISDKEPNPVVQVAKEEYGAVEE